MYQRRQSHGAQTVEPDSPEVALLVPSKHTAQYLLGQPAVQSAQLRFIVHVLQVVVNNRNIAHALFDAFDGDFHQRLRSALGTGEFLPPPPAAPESEAKEVLNLSGFVTREGHASPRPEQQS